MKWGETDNFVFCVTKMMIENSSVLFLNLQFGAISAIAYSG